MPGVAAVRHDALEQPLDDDTEFLGATSVWPSLGGSATAGSNVIVGIIDTGVWPEHPMLADIPALSSVAPTGACGCDFGDGTTSPPRPAFSCNNKLVGALRRSSRRTWRRRLRR